MESDTILKIALAGPLRGYFDYLPPEDKGITFAPGCRFEIPFGRSSRVGILISTNNKSSVPADKLKRALSQLDHTPLLQPSDLRLLKWAADYYEHPLGDVIFHALPVNLRKKPTASKTSPPGLRLTQTGETVDADSLSRAPKQRSVILALQRHPQGLAKSKLVEDHDLSPAVLRSLLDKGLVTPCELPPQPLPSEAAYLLNPQQKQAVDKVREKLDGFQAFLLNGVTGSGKTEVYLHLVADVLAQGRQALILVPEIGLTPQLLQRFQQRMGHEVAVLHSGLADGEREKVWHAIRQMRQHILIGTRSAVFTPMPDLGLVIVDEEHDLSYKQQEGFRYNARDISLVRAQQTGCPVILGSATPSLESLRNVQEGRYRQLDLPKRAADASMPSLSLIDIRNGHLKGGLSPALLKHLEQTLQAGEQAMLFLNRRGYAPMLTCHACGWLTDCPRCDARMTHHRRQKMLWCHHCGHQQREPAVCPSCGSPDLRPIGQGTERVEEILQQHFPNYPLARIDRDSTSRKGSLEKLLKQVQSGSIPLLIGTQMIAKGHHFPAVTLVAILDVDQGLFGADFRASERMAQLILQVAGRAGRAERPGRVMIQTRHPDHPLMQLLTQQGYAAFAKLAMQERQMAMLPPYAHQILIRAEATRSDYPELFLKQLLQACQKLQHAAELEFWGPVPAPMERRAGKTRAHLLIQSNQRLPLHRWLSEAIEIFPTLPHARKVRWSVDVDPQEML
ncbi:MAG: primosomal protein N' [Candidatus Thiodiazotropha lotti]|uniref:Replication restart protein PriA n=1 Tax=Candidatus Thiodiazotropha lotti TaxID=2792787 RepID=A0A9E4N0F6_9GAMM|nr:primosomal protein N' [Candidatus Thiodiazotropha lotti]ODB98759.1 primosomal protein N' [Candidatus Thiodiazotropha endoloripes]MCG7919922.1 primosomal protein N' [Candidatus Thiodiazotropha lotti]MCG7932280.1 primosomal protein N' [Candidatus Thiodiazotropha lotti]MCG7940532.1 primosomal protein N' [Candidatus Thiodiazotropha lotti]